MFQQTNQGSYRLQKQKNHYEVRNSSNNTGNTRLCPLPIANMFVYLVDYFFWPPKIKLLEHMTKNRLQYFRILLAIC